MKKIRGDKPVGVIIHIIHKETPCVASFISKKLKCHVFHFHLFSLFLLQIREQEARIGPAQWGGLALERGGRQGRKG
jgi:hypothetical protein